MAETFRPYGDTPAIESDNDAEIDSGIADSTEPSPEGVSQIYDANGQQDDNGGPVDSDPPNEIPDSTSVETQLGNLALDGSGVEDPGGGTDDVPQADEAADLTSRNEDLGRTALGGAGVEDPGGEIDSQAIPTSIAEASTGTPGTDFDRSDRRDDGDELDVFQETSEGASEIHNGDPDPDSVENLETEDDEVVGQENEGQRLIRDEAEKTSDTTSTNQASPGTDLDITKSQISESGSDASSPDLLEPEAGHETSNKESEHPPNRQDIASDHPSDESSSSAEDAEPTVASLDGGTSEGPDIRSDVAAKNPDLYQNVDAPLPNVDSPHEPPENWAPEINPAGGNENCGDCARATEQTWEGDPRVASFGGPEDDSVMSRWAGTDLESTSPDAIHDKLAEMGPGSSAIIGCNWEDGGGHWFNAVNDGGTVKAVDGQSGQVESWPPSDSGLGFNPADMKNVEAIYLDSDGKVVK